MKKSYYQNFKSKQADRIHISMDCPLCHGKYTYFNKSRHLKTARHKRTLEEKEKKII